MQKNNKIVTRALVVLSLIISVLPNFMPDTFKKWLEAALGTNYPIWWATVFMLLALAFIVLSFWSSAGDERARTGGEGRVAIRDVKSDATTIDLRGTGDVKIEGIESLKNSDIYVEGYTDVSVAGVTSRGNTTIKTS